LRETALKCSYVELPTAQIERVSRKGQGAKDDCRLTSENHVAQVLERGAVGELRVFLHEVHELDGVVGRLSLAVRRHAEHDKVVLGDGIEVIKVVAVRRIVQFILA
jgi:hypothetical protein